jgi:hypothetical protein
MAPMRRDHATPHPPARTAQIVVVALAAGVLVATVAMAVLRSMMEARSAAAQVMPFVLAGLGVAQIGGYLFLRRHFLGRAAAMGAQAQTLVRDGHVPQPLFQLAIIGAALAEGFGLLGAVSLLLGASWYVLAAPVLAIPLILVQLPTRSRLEEQLRNVRG